VRVGRTAVVVVLLVVMQVTVFPHLRFFGVVPDLGLVFAIAVAYYHGPEAGALVGFACGLLYDLFLETPLAMAALAYALTAYAVGLLQAGLLRAPRGISVLLGGVGGLAGGLVFIAIGGLAGVSGMWTAHALEVVALSAVYDALLAPAVFWLVRQLGSPERDQAQRWLQR